MLEGELDGSGEAIPLGDFVFELRFTGFRDDVELCFAAGFVRTPFTADEALLFQAVKGGVERALFDLKNFAGDRLDPFSDRPAVPSLGSEGLKDQDVESALNEVGRLHLRGAVDSR